MTAQAAQPAKQYAKQICFFLKKMPGRYAEDPQDVQDALGLTDEQFKLGVDWCVARGILEMDTDDDAEAKADAPAAEKPAEAPAAQTVSAFTMDDEDETEAVSPFKTAAAKDDAAEAEEVTADERVNALEAAWA